MIRKTSSKATGTRNLSLQNRAGIEKLSKSVSLFETAAKLQRDAEKQHREGNHERAQKSENIARAIQHLAAEKFLLSIHQVK